MIDGSFRWRLESFERIGEVTVSQSIEHALDVQAQSRP